MIACGGMTSGCFAKKSDFPSSSASSPVYFHISIILSPHDCVFTYYGIRRRLRTISFHSTIGPSQIHLGTPFPPIMDPVGHIHQAAKTGKFVASQRSANSGGPQMGGDPDMLIDEYDAVDEKPEVAVIHPDDSPEAQEAEPLADDCKPCSNPGVAIYPDTLTVDAMKARYLPELPDLEMTDEAISTWHIEDYRHLQTKQRGPTFECGGHPWYVGLGETPFRGFGQGADRAPGEYCSSPRATMSISHHSILNRVEKKVMDNRSLPTDGMPACNSLWCYGTRMILPYLPLIVREHPHSLA